MKTKKTSVACRKFIIALAMLGLFSAPTVEADLLANGGFENVPSSQTGQGILPSGWVAVSLSADTYSNDGSYGLPPTGYNNWPVGTMAFEGIRWVAGGRIPGIIESFGQTLQTPLSAGTRYVLSGYLHQAASRNNPGGYDIYLADDESGSNRLLLGFLGPTNNVAEGWTSHSIIFTAPDGADSRPFIIFEPTFVSVENTYPGLDAVSLRPVLVFEDGFEDGEL